MSRCTKVAYRDEIKAKLALAEIRKFGLGNIQQKRVYYCQPCKAWHLTSQSKRERMATENSSRVNDGY